MVPYLHLSPQIKAVLVTFTAFLSSFSVAHASDAFAAESPWMFDDWNGQRTALEKKGYDFSFGYTGEMATLLDAKYVSSHGTEYADQFAIGAHLDLEKIGGWKGTEAQINVTQRNGRNLSNTSDALNDQSTGVANGHLSSTQEVCGRGGFVVQRFKMEDSSCKCNSIKTSHNLGGSNYF